MVTTTAIPAFQPGIRTQLHHTMRQYCTRVCMSVPTRTDQGIDILRIVFLGQEIMVRQTHQEKEKKSAGKFYFIFHINRFAQDMTN